MKRNLRLSPSKDRLQALLATLTLAVACSLFFAVAAMAEIVTFDAEAIGTAWGGAYGDSPGDVVLTEDSIRMSVEEFYAGGFVGFSRAEIEPSLAYFGVGHILRVDNIGVKFYFADTGCAADTVRFDYADTGGTKNLAANGGFIYEVANYSALHGVVVAPGVTCYVTETPAGGGVKGTVTLAGAVSTLRTAGQELHIDRVRIVTDCSGDPGDPGSGNCDVEVTHDLEPLGMAWGGPYGDSPGDVAFTENGVPVTLQEYQNAGGPYFGECTIDAATATFGVNQTLRHNNIDTAYEIHTLGQPVAAVTFLFKSMGGEENLRVNGAPVFVGDIEAAPLAIAPGVTYSASSWAIPGGVEGFAILVGDVQRLLVGGQESWIDEVCVYLDETGDGCDILVNFETQPMGSAWGAAFGEVPGDHIFTEAGIPVGVDVITYGGGGTGFNQAKIDPSPWPCLELRTLNLNNISATYDIAALGVTTALVMFDYYDAGGLENLQVNGGGLHVGELDAAPYAIAPGVTCTVMEYPAGGNWCGRVILVGDVDYLLVAGQEFWMDNLCVIVGADGGPGDACDIELLFEGYPIGTNWGFANGDSPGDIIFGESGVDVSVVEFFDGAAWSFWNCSIQANDPATGVGSGSVLTYGAVGTSFDFTGLGMPIQQVTFEFVEYAGVENLIVNGETLFFGDLHTFPANVAAGVTMSVDWWPIAGGEVAGRVTLTGDVRKLGLGGQQFYIDNICVVLASSTGTAEAPASARARVLSPPYPNPFNPKTNLTFSLSEDAAVKLSIVDVAGREVVQLLNERRGAGSHTLTWEGMDKAGRRVPSGIYFARIQAGEKVEAKKLVLTK